jgi:hypothetical protein
LPKNLPHEFAHKMPKKSLRIKKHAESYEKHYIWLIYSAKKLFRISGRF